MATCISRLQPDGALGAAELHDLNYNVGTRLAATFTYCGHSEDPQIAAIKDLHKIGFTRGSVKTRIRNVEKSPTYLMAPVDVVASYRTYNLMTSALENLLHRVFAEVRLDVSQVDRWGHDYDASEWFVVPRDAIDKAVELIQSGEIVRYAYDATAQTLVEHTP